MLLCVAYVSNRSNIDKANLQWLIGCCFSFSSCFRLLSLFSGASFVITSCEGQRRKLRAAAAATSFKDILTLLSPKVKLMRVKNNPKIIQLSVE